MALFMPSITALPSVKLLLCQPKLRTPSPKSTELRQQLAEARPTLREWWDQGLLSNVRKKELLRVLIDKVVLQRPKPDQCEVRIVWKGGAFPYLRGYAAWARRWVPAAR